MMWLQSRLFILFSVIQLHSAFGKMNYIWNVMISWLLLQFLLHVHVQSHPKEVTIPISSPSIQLECDDDLKVNNIDVAIKRRNTTCSTTTADCTLPNDAIAIIKEKCNRQVSCEVDIRSLTNNQSCIQEYGYFNIWYTCKTVVDVSCDFESDLCNWSFYRTHGRFKWKHGLRDEPKPPTIDHTSASITGKYAYIFSSKKSKANDIARLESGLIIATEQQCLSFWYFTTNSRDIVNVYQNKEMVWNLSNYEEHKWHQLQIPVEKKSYTSYKVVFQVKRGKLSDKNYGAIVVDDILVENKNCGSFILKCDFESDSCDLNKDDSTLYTWRKQNGMQQTFTTGPSTDHTTANEGGYYMYLSSNDSTIAYLEFQNVNLHSSRNFCLTFWYHMNQDEDYGKEILNVTLNNELVWTDIGYQDDKWKKGTIDLHNRNNLSIRFIGILRSHDSYYTDVIDIAIDDISLTKGTCKGLFYHEDLCIQLDDKTSKETECPKGYLKIANWRLSFDPEKTECSTIYEHTKKGLLDECGKRDDSQKCLIDLSTDKSFYPECFQLYEFRIMHTCEDQETTSVLSITTSKRDSSAALESTTISSFTAPREVSSAVSEESVTLSIQMRNSATGLVVGFVTCALLLVCVVIVIVILIRRHSFKSRPREKIRNNIGGNDYIGSQDIALTLTANHSSHMQNNGLYDGSSNTSINGYDSIHANAQINNIQHEYTNLGTINGFVNKDKVQIPTYAHRQDKTFADNHMSNDNEYAIVDPTAETNFNESIDNRTATVGSYMVLDPTEMGFNRPIFSNTPVDYEFAKPVKDTEYKICDEDEYDISDEGVYDHSGSNRHKKSEDNIYNHAVDAIYDSGSHKRNNEGREDTYDHFFGQKTEDDYDISTTT